METGIRYTTDVSTIGAYQLRGGFFEGWARPVAPERHLEILRASDHVILALEGDRVIGFATAVSDGIQCAFVSLLEVLPHHRGRGVGTELMRRLLDETSAMYSVDLSCDEGLQPFYERFGMVPLHGMGIRRHDHRPTA